MYNDDLEEDEGEWDEENADVDDDDDDEDSDEDEANDSAVVNSDKADDSAAGSMFDLCTQFFFIVSRFIIIQSAPT